MSDYESVTEARTSIKYFLESVYNHKRLHSAIGYVPPAEFKQALQPQISSQLSVSSQGRTTPQAARVVNDIFWKAAERLLGDTLMKIVITGASGLVGTNLARHLAAKHQVLPLTHADLDITEQEAVRRLILNERPALIINCAVVSVDECERNPALAQAVNVAGPQALADAAAELEAEFLHYSTNYVFDGAREGQEPYTIDDEPYPINVYGRTKLAGERAVRVAASKCFIVRTSWVYGAGKDSFLSTVHRHLLAGKQVHAITDVWASTTYVDDLVARTEDILMRRHYATYHVVNSGVCSYEEFARLSARLVGVTDIEANKLIKVVYEANMQRLAKRPRSTPLRCLVSEKLGFAPLRDWTTALAEYLAK